jgi:hypothetical protein
MSSGLKTVVFPKPISRKSGVILQGIRIHGASMNDFVDKIFYAELAGKNPADVCRRADCRYDSATGAYLISVWDNTYAVFAQKCRVARVEADDREVRGYLGLFIVHYLLSARAIEPKQEWISEKDIPGGSTFFRGPHQIPTELIAERYADDVPAFCRRCEKLGGTRLEMADAAYRFTITARIPVAVLFWQGDDDFPAEAKILFDRTIAVHLASDIIYALAVEICHKIAGAAR